VALDKYDPLSSIGQVQQYSVNAHATYPIGLEVDTDTYGALNANFQGPNPFPVDVIVDRNGIIQYVAREYDPDRMQTVIESLLGP